MKIIYFLPFYFVASLAWSGNPLKLIEKANQGDHEARQMLVDRIYNQNLLEYYREKINPCRWFDFTNFSALSDREIYALLVVLREIKYLWVEETDLKRLIARVLNRSKSEPEALYNKAYCLYHGIGMEKDIKLARTLYEEAAGQGLPRAQWMVGNIHSVYNGLFHDSETVRWYSAAANNGFPRAQLDLGLIYLRGGRCVEKSYKKAFKLCKAAAEQGLAEAQYNLAYFYFNGYGIEQNPDKALELALEIYAAMDDCPQRINIETRKLIDKILVYKNLVITALHEN